MKKLFLFALIFTQLTAFAEKPEKSKKDPNKVSIKFGGQVDLLTYFDTYNSIDTRNGVQYYFPLAPVYNGKGEDVNRLDRIRFSVAPTRLNFAVKVPKLSPSASARAFVEADFMGATSTVLGGVRLRHAFFEINWKNQSLLLGQTSHLIMPDSIAPSTVTFGGGFCLSPLNRPIQVRFKQRFLKNSSFEIAAAMMAGNEGDMQSFSVIPDIHARLNFNFGKHTIGLTGGLKVLKPRNLTADSSKTNQTLICFDAAAYYKVKFSKHSISLYAMWGQDANALGIIGGYAPLLVDKGMQDYRYGATSSISAWLDYQTPTWKGFYAGIFAGAQKNLGSIRQLDLDKQTIPNYGIDAFVRIAPRIAFNYKMLTFGLEYMFSQASWAKSMDSFYCPTELYRSTYNNRITILARFKF